MFTDFEVDNESKSVVASWFGVDLHEKDELKSEERSKKPKVKTKKNNKGEAVPDNQSNDKQEGDEVTKGFQVFTLGLPQTDTVSGFVGEKLKKKMKKLKGRRQNIESENGVEDPTNAILKSKEMNGSEVQESKMQNDKKKKDDKARKGKHKLPKPKNSDDDDNDDEICSKAKIVKSSNKEEKIPVKAYTAESLQAILNNSKDMSKSCRKRLKKKLNKLLSSENNVKTSIHGSINSKENETIHSQDDKEESEEISESEETQTVQKQIDTPSPNITKKKKKISENTDSTKIEKKNTVTKNIDNTKKKKQNKKLKHKSSKISDTGKDRDSPENSLSEECETEPMQKILKLSDLSESEEENDSCNSKMVPSKVVNGERIEKDKEPISDQGEVKNFTRRHRKRHKTRSKQKNIRKDNRPDHLKPSAAKVSS